uniref:SPRY domain-containing protein n=1 Tax=Leishmania utingensis TaxID=653362 RepID=A0AAW3AI21_9TRYP
MFYSGWNLLAPAFMNVGALSAELRHSNAAGDAAAAYLTQDLLLGNDDVNSSALATTQQEHQQSSTHTTVQSSVSPSDGGDVARHTLSSTSVATEERLCTLPSPARKRRSHDDVAKETGCVLHLAARAALSFKEMEQLLHHRTTGSSDCFHVKSNTPAMSQAAVVFMECVVAWPSGQQGGAAETNANRDNSSVPPATSATSKPTLPALVLGVCQRSLEWYNLPGEAENSVGFYVAQRLIVKNGYEDGDAVKLPDDGRSGVGGSRVNFGDHVGCLIDLVRHQLAFTVNKDIVSTLPLEPSLADGSYYFAIGLARRPQQAADVVVRFYSGAQCLNQDVPLRRDGSSLPHPQQRRQSPMFPLAKYVRELALQSVGFRTTFMSGQEGESRIRRSAVASSSEQQRNGDSAAASHHYTKSKHPDAPIADTFCGRRIPLTPETLRDTRVTAVLRDYLSVRGMTSALQTLDAELHELAPAQSQLYTAAGAADGGTAGVSSPPPSPLAPPRSHPSHVLWRPPTPGEAQEAWQRYAADMNRLRTALLQEVPCDAGGAPTPPLSTLLGQLTLWRPSLAYAFASVFDSHLAAASAGSGVGAGGKPHRSGAGAGAPVPLSPYDWVRRAIHPSLLTLSMLALRQDIRYLVHSYQAVEEMWAILQTYLRAARTACRQTHADPHAHHPQQQQQRTSFENVKEETLQTSGVANGSGSKLGTTNHPPSRQGTAGRSSDHHCRTPTNASFAPTPEAEGRVQAAFTSFFTQFVWNPARVLPSPMTHIRRAPLLSGPATAAARTNSLDTLAPTSLYALAALAGRTEASIVPHSTKTRSASYDSHSYCRADADEEDFRACAAACAASVRLSSSGAASGSGNGSQEEHRQLLPQQRPLYVAHVEEAILVLYRSAVVPSPSPSRSSQVCLLQTLSSLHTHTVSTLRQMERFLRHGGIDLADRTVMDSIDLLSTLLRTVQHRYRQQVWRRLVHVVEDVNQQLEERLQIWGAVAQPPQRLIPSPAMPSSSLVPPAVIAGPRRWRTYLEGWVGGEDDAEDRNRSNRDAVIPEDDEATRRQSQARSLTINFSPLRADETPTHEALAAGKKSEGHQPSLAEAMRPILDFPSYEDLTTFMPSLRSLWRRVAARAALEPSLHLVTELFVHELRRSLCLAPPLGWHQRAFTAPSAAPKPEPSTPAAVSTEGVTTTVAAVKSEPNVVTVKRPLSVAPDHSSVSFNTPTPRSARSPGMDDVEEEATEGGETEAVARWFAEELYLSSTYMKRVFKHMSGS